MGNKDVWRSSFSVFWFVSVPYPGLGSVTSETGAASFHNLVPRDGVKGVQGGYFTMFGTPIALTVAASFRNLVARDGVIGVQ